MAIFTTARRTKKARSNPFGLYEEEIEPGIVFIPKATDSALDNPYRHNPGDRFTVTSKRGKSIQMTRRQIETMGRAMLAPGEAERVLGRSNPKRRVVASTFGDYQYMGSGEDDIGISLTHHVGKVTSKKDARKFRLSVGAQDRVQKLYPGERAYEVTFWDKYDRRNVSTLVTGKPAAVKKQAEKEHGANLREIREIKAGDSMHEYANPSQDRSSFERELEAMRERGDVYSPSSPSISSPSKPKTYNVSRSAAMKKAAMAAAMEKRYGHPLPNPFEMSRSTERALTKAASAAAGELTRAFVRSRRNPKGYSPDDRGHAFAGVRRTTKRGEKAASAVQQSRDVYADESADQLLASQAAELEASFMRRLRRNPSPVPGISVEEVIADIGGQEWANWDLNRAGIMHWQPNPKVTVKNRKR